MGEGSFVPGFLLVASVRWMGCRMMPLEPHGWEEDGNNVL